MTAIIPAKPKWAFSLTDYVANKLVADPSPRSDATHRKFVKKTGGIFLELGPLHEKNCGERYRALETARDERVNNAAAVREQKLKAARGTYDQLVESIEAEHRNIAATATTEFEAAEQRLLAEFALPPSEPVNVAAGVS